MRKIHFAAKRFGWGWTPCTWQGWLITAAFLVGVLLSLRLSTPYNYISSAILVIILLVICWRYGEKPRWRWG